MNWGKLKLRESMHLADEFLLSLEKDIKLAEYILLIKKSSYK